MSTKVCVVKKTSIFHLQDYINKRMDELESSGNEIVGNVSVMYDGKYVGLITYRRLLNIENNY